MRRPTILIGWLTLLTMVVTGCSTAAPRGESPRPSDTPSVEPAPSASARPSADELVIGPDGVGDLAIGSPVPQTDPAIAIVEWDPEACTGMGVGLPGYPFDGLWESTVDATNVLWAGRPAFGIATGSSFAEIPGEQVAPVQIIEMWTEQIATDRGIRIGSTEAEVEAAYPDVEPSSELNPSSRAYLVPGADGTMVIEIGVADEWGDSTGTVLVISVIASPAPPVSSLNTESRTDCPV